MPSRAGQARFSPDGQKGVHMAGSPGRRRRGLLPAVVAALVAAGMASTTVAAGSATPAQAAATLENTMKSQSS